ncbi:MAG: hypothetical protein HYV97_09980 [Bdellovibrio sp.]|nr:hypothetical protein [Bdellovibrio sp.]
MKFMLPWIFLFIFLASSLAQNADSVCGNTATYLLKYVPSEKKYQVEFVREFDKTFCHYPALSPQNANIEVIYFDKNHSELLRKKLFFNHEIFYDAKDPKSAALVGGVAKNLWDLTLVLKFPILPGKNYFSYEVKRLDNGLSVGSGKL